MKQYIVTEEFLRSVYFSRFPNPEANEENFREWLKTTEPVTELASGIVTLDGHNWYFKLCGCKFIESRPLNCFTGGNE